MGGKDWADMAVFVHIHRIKVSPRSLHSTVCEEGRKGSVAGESMQVLGWEHRHQPLMLLGVKEVSWIKGWAGGRFVIN